MNGTIWVWLLRATGFIVGLVLTEALRRFWRKKPCWFFGHDKKYVALEKWSWSRGDCTNDSHPTHLDFEKKEKDGTPYSVPCFIGRWVCTKCPTLGLKCIGSVYQGAWKIEQGEIAVDEKEWANQEGKRWVSNR